MAFVFSGISFVLIDDLARGSGKSQTLKQMPRLKHSSAA